MNSTSHQIPYWVQERINEVKEKGLTELDLSSQQAYSGIKLLQVIPDEIFNLTWLEKLYLNGNELTFIPDVIDKLVDLRELYLRDNQLQNIPKSVSNLNNLQILDLRNNQLATFPSQIINLNQLKILGLSWNQLTTLPEDVASLQNIQEIYLSNNNLIRLPDGISRLRSLVELHLGNNQLETLPNSMGELQNLRELYLSRNNLTLVSDSIRALHNLTVLYLSSNQLQSIPEWLFNLPKLSILYLGNNPIVQPAIEVLNFDQRGKVNLEKTRNYFRQLKEEGEEQLFEAKLLIGGEPGAGKTSLARKIINPEYQLVSSESSTDGIDIYTWEFEFSLSKTSGQKTSSIITGRVKFRVNIWDFGGQEIYLATHQFFFTRHSLYVVVSDAREQKTDFFHWLGTIEQLSDGSPTLIFHNEKQDRQWQVNTSQLRAHFPNLMEDVFAFNLLNDNKGLERLRQAIQYHITHLPHIGTSLPRTWVNVRHALEEDFRPYISLDEFLSLCQQNGFTKLEDKFQLSSYLHDLGIILHFQDNPLLKKTIFLRQEWIIDAVYHLLANKDVQRNMGQFDQADANFIWHDQKYNLIHDELLALMMKFQLCYEVPSRSGRYIMPSLLSEKQPNYEWPSKKNLLLRYKYKNSMPRGIIARLIVSLHAFIAQNKLVWRTGVVLNKDETAAEVIEYYHQREIRIRVAGSHKRDLLTIITHELDKLQRPFKRLKCDKLIPCNCPTCCYTEEPHFYQLEVLKTRLAHNKETIECDQPPFHSVNIWGLIDDVDARAQIINDDELLTLPKRPKLLSELEGAFNEEEIRTFCFDLGIEYDDLPAQGRINKMRELISRMEREGRLAELVQFAQKKRPHRFT